MDKTINSTYFDRFLGPSKETCGKILLPLVGVEGGDGGGPRESGDVTRIFGDCVV